MINELKYCYSLTLLVVFPIFLRAQAPSVSFSISGQIADYKAGEKIYLSYRAFWDPKNKNRQDSSLIENGNFGFNGQIDRPIEAYIRRSNGESATIFLDRNVELFINGPLKDMKVLRSAINADLPIYDQAMLTYRSNYAKTLSLYRNASKEKRDSRFFQDSLRALVKRDLLEKTSLQRRFIEDHPGNYFSFVAFREIVGSSRDTSVIGPIFRQLSPSLRRLPEAAYYLEVFSVEKLTGVGNSAPSFQSVSTDGRPVKLSDYRGKYLLLDFWASWCGPCKDEMPNVVAAKKLFSSVDFEVLGVSLDKEVTKINCVQSITSLHMDWITVYDPEEKISHMYGITNIPRNFLISPEGIVIAKDLRGEELIRILKMHLN